MQSFSHTAAYPKLVDVQTHRTLPGFISTRGGVALRPSHGVIHFAAFKDVAESVTV
jgi:aconitate hydratase 2 / 2-methylisocitrate dehydratase